MERTKDKVENLMTYMESALVTEPVPFFSLRRRWSKAETIWSTYEDLFDQLCAVTHEEPDVQDRDDFATFQEHYTNVHGRVQDVLDKEQSEEEARLKELKDAEDARLKTLASKQKVEQYTANLKAAHLHIDKKLEEIKAGLEGEAISSLEVLKVEENRLMQVKEILKESKSLLSSIINEEPEQTDTLVAAEGAKVLQADSKISACEKILAGFQATINKTSGTGTTIEASAAPAMTTSALQGPQFQP